MLFIYHAPIGTAYFYQHELTERVHYDSNAFLYEAKADLTTISSRCKYVVGNDINTLINRNIISDPTANQYYIDVNMYYPPDKILQDGGLQAVVKIYNDWIIHESEIASYKHERGEYWNAKLPEDYTVERVEVARKNKFNKICEYLTLCDHQSTEIIGMTWPTCHYLADRDPYIHIYYRTYRTVSRGRHPKQLNKLI